MLNLYLFHGGDTVFVSVCVSVFDSVQNMSTIYERTLMKFCGELERGPESNRLQFVGDPVTFENSGSFSRIL